jgi:GH18 family chitinase
VDPAQGHILVYDNERSLSDTCDYVNERKLGGVMVWELDGDPDAILLGLIGRKVPR